MRRFLAPVAVLAAVVLGLACSPAPDSSEEAPARTAGKKVVLVVLDGVGATGLGSYGGSDATPSLDRFANEAVRFEWAFAQAPESTPSLASLLTGLYPTTHGLVEAGDGLAEEAETLAELTRAAGYSTAAFLAGAPGANDFGLGQGFDEFRTEGDAVAAAGAWIESRGDGDALLVVGLAPTPDAAAADAALNAALEAIDAYGGATVAVVSLAGTGGVGDGAGATPRLAAPVTRVPLLIRGPRFPAGATVPEIVEVVDIMPTLLEVVGVDPPAAVQGRSLVALVEGAGQPPYIAFGETPANGGGSFAALGGFYLVEGSGDGDGAAVELYDLALDPGAATDLAAEDERRTTVLRDHIEAWRKMTAAASLDPERRIEELDEDTLEKLRSLGYVQ